MAEAEVVSSPGSLKTWWIAMRPFSFPASAMSVVFGTALATTLGGASFHPVRFLLATLGMVALHAAANLLNDDEDYRRGLDTRVLPVSGAVVRGLLTPAEARRGAMVLLAVGGLLGLSLAAVVGWPVLVLGAVGIVVGVLYSAGPGLKYHALGDLSVFVDFGPLGSLGGWIVQGAGFAWLPVVWSVPLALLVIGILHANNWRDIESDKARGCTTVASLLGDRGSAIYYGALVFLPFLLIVGFIAVPRLGGFGVAMPVSFLLGLLALPLAVRLMQRGMRRHTAANPLDFLALDGATAQLNLVLGVLCTAAALLGAWGGALR